MSQTNIHLVRRIAEHNPDVRSYWAVTEASGPESERCINGAITMAQATGSVGATESRGGDDYPESMATVARVYDNHPEFDAVVRTFDLIDADRVRREGASLSDRFPV